MPAPIIWGFDLGDMKWSAFSSSEMFSRKWHLRRERFIIYQIAMLVCLAAECTATYSLAKYEKLQDHVEALSGHIASLHNDDIVASSDVTIVFCVLVATLFGADFFFLLFFPKRRYPQWYHAIKKACAVFITLGLLGATLMSTIVVASHHASIRHVTEEEADQLRAVYYRPPTQYNKWHVNVAWVVLLWIGWLATLASTIVMFVATDHDERLGPEAGHRLDTAIMDQQPGMANGRKA